MIGRTLPPLLALCLTACDLAPRYVRPATPTPPEWPTGASYPPLTEGEAGLPWRTVIQDQRLRGIVELALTNNRDLRAAVANVASARALYRAQRASRLPEVDLAADAQIFGGAEEAQAKPDSFTLGLVLSSFEIDLFGRQKNLSKAAFDEYLSTAAGMQSARIALITATASAYATLAADSDRLAIAQETLANGERTLALTRSLHEAGLAAATDVANATTIVAQAQSDVEAYTTQVAQDRNALNLLVGGPVSGELLPNSLGELADRIALVPAGLSSEVLLQRPDVRSAEFALQAANARIGAARAAQFPIISLTAAAGVASSALSTLFTGGSKSWSVEPQASLPLLGGPASANVAYARAQRDLAVAQYEQSIQVAFREVSDGLAQQGTIARQRSAQDRLVSAAQRSYDLSGAQYRAGTGSFLDTLVAQRTLYAAQQSAVSVLLTDITNRIALYGYIGSDSGQ